MVALTDLPEDLLMVHLLQNAQHSDVPNFIEALRPNPQERNEFIEQLAPTIQALFPHSPLVRLEYETWEGCLRRVVATYMHMPLHVCMYVYTRCTGACTCTCTCVRTLLRMHACMQMEVRRYRYTAH